MHTFLDPGLSHSARVLVGAMAGSPVLDLQTILRPPWNFLLFSSDAGAAAIDFHMTFDGTDPVDPTAVAASTMVPGVMFKVTGLTRFPLLFSKPVTTPVKIRAVGTASFNVWILHGNVETSQHDVQPVPGARVRGGAVGGSA